MRKLSFFLAFALVLTCAFGAFAQTHNAVISIDNVVGQYTPTQLRAGQTITVNIRYNCLASTPPGSPPKYWIGSNGYEVWSPDGADWVGLQGGDGPLITALGPTVVRYRKHFYFNGTSWAQTPNLGADPAPGSGGASTRVGYYLATADFTGGDGLVGGTSNGVAVNLTFQTRLADATLTMCVDSCKGITAWEWAAGDNTDFPQWDNGLQESAPRCYEIYEVPNDPPEWCQATSDNISFNHCAQGSYQLCANDGGDGPGPVTYQFAPGYETGFGALNATTGAWTWSGPTVPQDAVTMVEFLAHDGADTSLVRFQLHVTVTNRAPTITCPPVAKTVSINTCKTQTVTVADLDVCDLPLTITINDVTPAVNGTYSVTGNVVEFCPLAGDENQIVHFEMMVDDGAATAICDMQWNVIAGAPYQVELEKKPDVFQGHFTDLFIKLHKIDITQGIGGFDFLVAYDASALAFQLAFEGDVYAACGWEYFTYRYGPYGNCGNACPSGMLRVVGLAETNNGPEHPGCNSPEPGFVQSTQLPIVLAYLRFLVSNDRTLECTYVPVRFFWYDCGDNTLSNFDGSELYLSQKVFDFCEYDNPFLGCDITGSGTHTFPTFQGAPDICIYENTDLGKIAKRNVDFQNGGVDIICEEDIDARGDINLNGLGYEIADAVMFTNYFISGLAAFGDHIEGSIAASDTNADGLALTVADLVYLIRVVIGDAMPYDKVSPMVANVTFGDGVFSVDAEMGAAYIVVAGDVTPDLMASNMEMKYGFNGENTNILVYSTEANQSFSGDFLRANGRVVSTEFATFTGQMVTAKVMPANFALHQNYPNPFNPTTTIKIDIPKVGVDYKLNIYNVTGQLVETITGTSTGFDEVVWDASGLSSGIYFYKLSAGDFTATKKAVLLK